MTEEIYFTSKGCSHLSCDLAFTKRCVQECRLHRSMIDAIKKLLDQEVINNTMTIHPRRWIEKAVINGDTVVVISNVGEVVGFVYLAHWEGYVEIAGLVIREDFRSRGLGHVLFGRILVLAETKYPQKKIIFFANNLSEKIGKKYGFSPMPKLLTNPKFQSLCKNCTKEYKKPRDCRCKVMILSR